MDMDKRMAKAIEEREVRAPGERYTKFLKMWLPGEQNFYRLEEDQNQNFEKIDGALENAQRMATDLFSKKQDKTDSSLNTSNKTVVGGINENKAYTDGLAASKAVNSFPLSRATEGNVYRVPQTNKYVICTSNYNGGQISLPNGNFEELSAWKNRNKLDNVKFFETADYKAVKNNKTVTLTIDTPKALKQNQEIFKLPKELRPSGNVFCVGHDMGNRTDTFGFGNKAFIWINTNGSTTFYNGASKNRYLNYITVTYITD